jgi:hypothetical protein
MPIFSALAYQFIHSKPRRGLRDENESDDSFKRSQKQRTGVRGETHAYWYLRQLRYVFVAKNYTLPGGAKDELDRLRSRDVRVC